MPENPRENQNQQSNSQEKVSLTDRVSQEDNPADKIAALINQGIGHTDQGRAMIERIIHQLRNDPFA